MHFTALWDARPQIREGQAEAELLDFKDFDSYIWLETDVTSKHIVIKFGTDKPLFIEWKCLDKIKDQWIGDNR